MPDKKNALSPAIEIIPHLHGTVLYLLEYVKNTDIDWK